MKISTKEQYGLRAMVRLAQQYGEGPIPLGEVAQAQSISLDYLEQIVPSLRNAGLLNSTRGAKGGYELSRPPDEITVGEVLRALDGDMLTVRCMGGENAQACAQIPTCATRTVWQTIHNRVLETLDGMTLDDL